MKLKGKSILIISNEPWGDVWYSKQNYAFELSRYNQVLFLNPVKKWSPISILSSRIRTTRYSETLHILDYGNPLPVRTKQLDQWNNKIISKRLRKWITKNHFNDYMVWTFDPHRLYDAKLLGARLGIFHYVDMYGAEHFGSNQLYRNSDVILATSPKLIEGYSHYNKPTFHIPHGISKDEYVISADHLEKIKSPLKRYGLYTGAIDYRMDFSLVEKALQEFKHTNFLFIGPIQLPETNDAAQRIFTEKKYSNALAIGPRHYKELKYFIHLADFCISFLDVKHIPNTISNHKTLGYLAQGKPIFSPVFHAYKELGDIIYMSNDHNELLELMGNFFKKGEEEIKRAKRIEYSKKYLFDKILTDIGKHLSEILHE